MARRRPGEPREKPRYQQQPDPSEDVPLAWIFKHGNSVVGRTPPQQHGTYKKLVMGQDTWFVHCSYAGALEFILLTLGEGNITIDEESTEGEIIVPEEMVGSWVGVGGCIAGFLKQMFGLDYIRIKGVNDWRYK